MLMKISAGVARALSSLAFLDGVGGLLMSRSRCSGSLCPFDGLPCEIVSSCDEVLLVLYGVKPEWYCSRAVLKVVKK